MQAYLFEAKGIQRYILDSGPLRDLVGASDLVDALARSEGDDLIGRVLEALAVAPNFSRRAGGAFVLHGSEDALTDVRALWRLVAGLACPGLDMADALGQGSDLKAALTDAHHHGSAVRFNTAAELPPAGHPFTAFNPRTGRVATRLFRYRQDRVFADLLTETQRHHADRPQACDRVGERFLAPGRRGEPWCFPRNLDPDEGDDADNPLFPFRGADDRRIAVVHADLSGLGQVFRKAVATASTPQQLLARAAEIQRAIEGAAQAATEAVLLGSAVERSYGRRVIPARPVVLGGDDVTVLVRADLALPFAVTLLRAIEDNTKGLGGSPERHLSACAGVAIAKAGQPFLMVHALAESLCHLAKTEAKRHAEPYPSLLAFHIAQSTVQEDYGSIQLREKCGPGGVTITANPLEVSAGRTGRPAWDGLAGLAHALAAEPRGRGKLLELRDLLTAEGDGVEAAERWERYREVLGKRNRAARDAVDAALGALGVPKPDALPLIDLAGQQCCPIPDALELIDLGALS